MSASVKLSQLAPLPRIKDVVSGETIGHGGFGIVKKSKWMNHGNQNRSPYKVIAVKYVYLGMASAKGITAKDLAREAYIQKACRHENIIELYEFGYDTNWVWMTMEFGAQGELFDKIEPDLGIEESIAHFYFVQLLRAVDHIHKQGVAHRDIKPENLVLDNHCNLKLTDFGLATVFKKKTGPKRMASKACGSLPYVAPEITTQRYDPEVADVWSCGIVLFVLLTGQIAWEMPHENDPDYQYFLSENGKSLGSPWDKLSFRTLSVLRKILNPDTATRITIPQLFKNSWVSAPNEFMDSKSKMCKDPMRLVNKIMLGLHINLSDEEYDKVNASATQQSFGRKTESQPARFLVDDTPRHALFKENYVSVKGYAASQEVYSEYSKRRKLKMAKEMSEEDRIFQIVSEDPAAIQFAQHDKEESRQALINKKLANIDFSHPVIYANSLTRFFSVEDIDEILFILVESLIKLGLRGGMMSESTAAQIQSLKANRDLITLPINGKDSSNSPVIGSVRITKLTENSKVHKIEFVKSKGDPLAWRRIFKRVTILSRKVVYIPRR
ncbi:unnamed protein product [Ambrosiozyma monospora]|uniref:Unnamed protein product n=1 Tax=Ambrosiozyma monospora TaxID=43982 RepID=A0ACB5T1X2_AMBMO|nr:unnamed protein product [Ambrosiozyma monospora]